MGTTFGLTPAGFIPMQQADVVNDLNAAFQSAFGANVNLAPTAILGQIVGIFSERFALLWQLGEAIYISQYPSGAEGTSVDNILALNNLSRLPATATVTEPESSTNPTTLVTQWGLVLLGTEGTIIPAGSVIQSNATPPVNFTLDDTLTIGASANAVQTVYFGNVPTQGAFELSIVDSLGNTLTTPSMPWTIEAAVTQLVISTTPGATSHFELTLTQAGVALTTGQIATNSAYPTAGAIQSAITALSGYSGVTVSGAAGTYAITWGSICNPLTTVAANTTGATITPTDSVQAGFNSLHDSSLASGHQYPFTDVVVSGTFSGGFVFSFGAGTVIGSNPNSKTQQEPLMLQAVNTLQNGSTVTNINVTNTTIGLPAQVTGTATCEVTGPNYVAANTLNVIGSPISGWSSVNNQLDCVTGSNAEDDTQAMTRRTNELAAQANGPLQAIVDKVREVTGVTQAIGFQNLNDAALQLLTWATVPASGAYEISIGGETTTSLNYNASAATIQAAMQALTNYPDTLVTGDYVNGFTFDFNGAQGGQSQSLLSISPNTTGVTPTVVFSRPGHSFEIVAQGGTSQDIANAIYGSMPAGIKSYGTTTVSITDAEGNQVSISFSRPSTVTFYVTIALVTDTYNTPGNSGSGANSSAKFNAASIATIQQDIINIGSAFPIGGTVIGFGTNGLIGAFNSVPGIVSYSMSFDKAPSPSTNTNVQLLPEQVALFESFNVVVSWT